MNLTGVYEFLIGCDWGTTSFRLRLINIPERKVVHELKNRDGVTLTYGLWRESGEDPETRMQFFCKKLKQEIDILSKTVAFDLNGLPVIVSGMASSSIGMQEILYASLPIALEPMNITTFVQQEAESWFPHELILVSGIKSSNDVMRGEETQLIGLLGILKIPDNEEIVAILPGTHSKHNFIKNNVLSDFQTFMTGEVYDLLSHYSILRGSVEDNGQKIFTPEQRSSFISGVKESQSKSILANIFRVRTNHLFGLNNKSENAYYLSGLLIGAELSYLADSQDSRQIVICGEKALSDLYQLALEAMDLTKRLARVPADFVERSTVAGQIRIFESQSYQNITNE